MAHVLTIGPNPAGKPSAPALVVGTLGAPVETETGPSGLTSCEQTNVSLAARIISWLGQLSITQGRLEGQPFKVLPWQRKFIYGAFESGIDEAALSVARGNGKTTLLAGVALANRF